ncbi:MAG TPA: hypothetical protein VL989_00210 [Candidatus Sulfotelmatobacter sp.]|nr:hypothetical protein [Candidatus Sulfotelmatobacter sp.]
MSKEFAPTRERLENRHQVLSDFEQVGSLMFERWQAETLPQISKAQTPNELKREFQLSSGRTAEIIWRQEPELFREGNFGFPRWLESGVLTLKGSGSDRESRVYVIGRSLSNDTRHPDVAIIADCTCPDNGPIRPPRLLFTNDRELGQIATILDEISASFATT